MRPAIPRFVSLSFSSPTEGAGLSLVHPSSAAGSASGGPRAVVSTTADGGARWARAWVFPAADGVRAVLDVSSRTLFAWGRGGLWSSEDGGRRFARVLAHPVGQVGVVGSSVWVLGWPCALPSLPFTPPSCQEVLWTSNGTSARFVRRSELPKGPSSLPVSSALGTAPEELQRLGRHVAYLFAPLGPRTATSDVSRSSALLVTTDGGRRWAAEPDPCVKVSGSGPFAAYDAFGASAHGVLWLACGGEPAAGSEAKVVERSVDGGKRWTRVASAGITGTGQASLASGYVSGIVVRSSASAYLLCARASVLHLAEGGQRVSLVAALPRSVRVMASVGREDLWAWSYDDPGQLWRSVDGGKRWTHVGPSTGS